jgi:hypothetical protein
MTLAQVERRLGSMIEVVMGEIESREFATFPRLPRWLLLQADNGGATAGVYESLKRTTRTYAGGSAVQSPWLNQGSAGALNNSVLWLIADFIGRKRQSNPRRNSTCDMVLPNG